MNIEITKNKIPHMASIKETAKIFGLPQHFIRSKALAGDIVSVRAGNSKILINVDKFSEYLNSSTISTSNNVEQTGIQPISARL